MNKIYQTLVLVKYALVLVSSLMAVIYASILFMETNTIATGTVTWLVISFTDLLFTIFVLMGGKSSVTTA